VKQILLAVIALLLSAAIAFIAGYLYHGWSTGEQGLFDPLPKFTKSAEKELSLRQYGITQLAEQIKTEQLSYQPIQVLRLLTSDPTTHVYTLLFTYQSRGQQISGALNLKIDPAAAQKKQAVVLMLRGYAPQESYYSGMGTKNAASAFAEEGYLTIAPDFLGYGDSDPESSDTWEARFIKPLQVIDLLATIKQHPQIDLSAIPELPISSISVDADQIGIWAHSNGGQIAVTTLEILDRNLPATLWAPVLAPFPYSILYFSDENADEGKEARKWLSLFEADYDVFDFSLTKHLDKLHGPIQIQHGERDDSALISWTREFLDKVSLENQRRVQLEKDQQTINATANATLSAVITTPIKEASALKPIQIDFYPYQNANHNLQPNWQQAIERDLEFFARELKSTASN